MSHHIGRSWDTTPIEDACPCPQEPCGLIDTAKTSPDCDQHHVGNGHYARTMRQGHAAERCPGPRAGHHARLAAEDRPWCGAPRDLGGQQPCPIAEPCDARTCRIGSAVGNETYRLAAEQPTEV